MIALAVDIVHCSLGHNQCPVQLGGWNREVPLYIEVSSFQGVGIERFHYVQRCGISCCVLQVFC